MPDREQDSAGSSARVAVTFRHGDEVIELDIGVPNRPVAPVEMLPVYQHVANSVIESVVRNEEPISCRKGCGACCRQMVPIAPIEARRLRQLLEEMPEPRRFVVRERFRAAVEQLISHGLAEALGNLEPHSEAELFQLGLEYFRLGIACPFLEEESCSIHPDRPLSCREYLVTSPAEHCGQPDDAHVRRVPLPMKPSRALLSMERDPARRYLPAIPLILALDWVEENGDDPPPRQAPELLMEFLTHLRQEGAR